MKFILYPLCFLCLVLTLSAFQMTAQYKTIICLTQEQMEILSHMSLVELPDGFGNQCKTIRIEGVNVQIVNGLGQTDSTNCLGNLIVGYNETGGSPFGDERTGSHNIINGDGISYTSFSGYGQGFNNTMESPWTLVHGQQNQVTPTGGQSAIIAGVGNLINFSQSAVVRGFSCTIDGYTSLILGSQSSTTGRGDILIGGRDNVSTNTNTWQGNGGIMIGGEGNMITPSGSFIKNPIMIGGAANMLTSTSNGTEHPMIVGGQFNVITDGEDFVTVVGGLSRSASAQHDIRVGSILEEN